MQKLKFDDRKSCGVLKGSTSGIVLMTMTAGVIWLPIMYRLSHFYHHILRNFAH